jgi:hypothetical protein
VIAQVELKCECGRTVKLSKSVLLERKAQGKALRCVACGKDLALPREIMGETAAVAPAVKRVRTRCPLCEGQIMAPEEGGAYLAKCAGCAISFRCDEQGTPELDAPSATPATADEVQALAPRLAQRVAGPELQRALEWRFSKKTIAAGHPAAVLDTMDKLAAWRTPPRDPFLPLPVDQSLLLVGPIVFRTSSWELNTDANAVTLVQEVTEGEPAVLAIGLRVSLKKPPRVGDVIPEARRVRAESQFFGRREPMDGCSFVVKVYVDRKQQYFSADEAEKMIGEFFHSRIRLEALCRAQLIFGALVHGSNAPRITREAVIARLKTMGFAAADAARLAPHFVVDAQG